MKPHTTQCVDEGQLQAYRDRALPDAEREVVISHLSTCVSCRHRVEGLDAVAEQVGALMPTIPYAPDPQAALERLRSRQAEASRAHGLERPLNTIPRVINALAQRRPDMKTGINRRPLRVGMAFALAIALLALGAATLFNRPASVSAAEVLDKAHEASASIPEGKVRHIVTSITNKRSGGGEITTTTEDWQATEKGLNLAKSVSSADQSSMLADGTTMWLVFPQTKVVHKLANVGMAFAPYVSNRQMVEEMLKLPNATIVGKSMIDGREVLIIEGRDSVDTLRAEMKPKSGSDSSGDRESNDMVDGVFPEVSASSGHEIDLPVGGFIYYRMWIDSQTYQIVQQEFGTISASGVAKVNSVQEMLVDELKDRSDFPSDLFTFKAPEGFQVIDQVPTEMNGKHDSSDSQQGDGVWVSETPVP